MATIDSKIPEGALAEKWTNYKAHQKLVNPANKRRLDIIVVGTGFGRCFGCCFTGCSGFQGIKLLYPGLSPVVHTLSLHREVSMLLRIIKMMVTLFTVFSTIQSKVVTTVHAKLTFIVWPRCPNAIIDQCVAQGVPFRSRIRWFAG